MRRPPHYPMGHVLSSTGGSKEEFVVKCRNFTAVIEMLTLLSGLTTLSGNYDLVMRIANDDYRSGVELGSCIYDKNQKKDQRRERIEMIQAHSRCRAEA